MVLAMATELGEPSVQLSVQLLEYPWGKPMLVRTLVSLRAANWAHVKGFAMERRLGLRLERLQEKHRFQH